MLIDELIIAVRELLEHEGRVAYRMLKRRFELNDDDLEDIKAELIDAKRIAADEDGKVMVWLGAPQDDSAVTHSRAPAAANVADRRLIAVMFCDIVGSTEYSARFDAEELRDIVREYQQICSTIIARCDGHVAQYLGDGLLVYFGYPAALEDEAGRSVQASLEILAALRDAEHLNTRLGGPLRVRIGIHTGSVVIGEMGGAERHETLALGETPNIAARVQSAASPDEILITATTHRLVDGLYECELHGSHTLKGVAKPVDLYSVRGESAPLNRYEVALSTGNLTDFVGRQEELQLLGRHWAQARSGYGQVVLLSGEAGIGKSRLVQEFKKELGPEAHQITLRCSPNHQDSAFYPLAQLLRRVFGIESDDPEAVRINKLEEGLREHSFTKPQTAPLLASLLGLVHPQAEILEGLEPQARTAEMFEALVEWFREQSAERPLYLVWDDVHWMDPATDGFLSTLIERIPATRTLAVLAFRSDFVPPWSERTFLELLSVGRLPERDVDAMISHLTERENIPLALGRHIKSKTDGIPLYVEELTKAIVDGGLLDEREKFELSDTLQGISIPATLQDSLEARIDSCPHGKLAAQWGAVIGREFGLRLLGRVIKDRALLSSGLNELLDAELIYRSGTAANPTFIFKHALIRDTAYESLLNKHRRVYHADVANALEEHFPETVKREPELLAFHFTQAANHERAIEHLFIAGKRAIERSAEQVAQAHFRQALQAIPAIPEGTERTALELKLLLLLGPLLSAALGNAADEVEALYQRAVKLCRSPEHSGSRFPAYFGLRACHLAKSDLKSAHEIGEALFRAAAATSNQDILLEAHVALAGSYFFRGDTAAVAHHSGAGLKLYKRKKHSRHALLYGIEPGVACLVRNALTSWMQGFPEQAEQSMSQALISCDEIGHSVSRAFAYGHGATLSGWLRNYDEADARATVAIAVAHQFGIAFADGWSLLQRGHAHACRGQHESAHVDLAAGLEVLEQSGQANGLRSQLMYTWFMSMTAEAHGELGAPEKGLALLPEAIALIEKTGARYPEPSLYRVRGDLLRSMGLATEARESLEHSLELAKQRGAVGFALRTALSLVELDIEQSATRANQGTLEKLRTAFTEGSQTHDLQHADRLLARIA